MPRAAILVVPLLLAVPPPSPAEPYRVGPGDVLEVLVRGRADLSRLPTVQTTGEVFLPRAGHVTVAGLTTKEIAARIAPLLAGDGLPDPDVSVRVQEYKSQFVWVHGQVLNPGRKALRGGTRLIDALLDAGGFTSRASGLVRIERRQGTFPDGRHSLTTRFTGDNPSPAEIDGLSLRLVNGDVIFVGTQHWVVVSGEIAHPGRYPLEDGLTLSGLIEQAGGCTPFGSDRVTVSRSDTGAGGTSDIEADLKAIRSGTTEDLVLAPGDRVAVPTRGL
jgi:protein involved in polysaccharide export with SLBB domain